MLLPLWIRWLRRIPLLHPRRQRISVRFVPIVAGHIPHDRREAKLDRGAQHIRAAGAERRPKPLHCFASGILDGLLAALQLFPDPRGPLPQQ